MSPNPVSAAPVLPAGKAAVALAIYDGANRAYSQSRELWRSHFAYSVAVSERDPLYSDVHSWLLSIMPDERHRSLLVSSGNSRSYDDLEPTSDSGGSNKPTPLTIRFDDKAVRKVIIGGHNVSVQLHNPAEVAESAIVREPEPKKILFVCKSYMAQKAVIKELERINSARRKERKAVLRMVNSWGSWRTRSDLPPRTLPSVSLPDLQMNRIVKDLEAFLASEDRYNRLAIPWHRGYMFHGPAGTGKTSLVKALACHFNLDLWYISLSDLKAESGLMGLLSEVGPRSILLLEDIDTIKITHDRDSSEQGTISMSSLLNTLDGVATPHGLITMMTTNRFEILDTALTRAGRMDLIEKLDFPSQGTVAMLFHHFYGRYPDWHYDENSDKPIEGLSTAQVAELFKHHLNNPEAAEKAVLPLLHHSLVNY